MRSLAIVLLAGAAAFAQPAVNFSGKWTIDNPGGRGGGRGGPQILTLNQVGSDVTGELGTGGRDGGSAAPVNNEIWDGKVTGDTISFYLWRGSDRPAKMFYKGQLNAAGDAITFTITGGPGRAGGPGGAAGQGSAEPAPAPPVVAKRTK